MVPGRGVEPRRAEARTDFESRERGIKNYTECYELIRSATDALFSRAQSNRGWPKTSVCRGHVCRTRDNGYVEFGTNLVEMLLENNPYQAHH